MNRSRTVCALFMLVASGSASGAQASGDPVASTASDAATRSVSALVRAGDHVMLQFLREPQLNAEIVVSERGDAPFPKLGMLHVTHLSIAGLQDTLRTRYAEYLRAPEIQVRVLRRIIVNGEVKLPNVYMLDVSSTVRDAVARAGGLTEMGNRKNVAIIRNGERVKVTNWELETGPVADLQSGDQIVVARKSWLSLNILQVVSTGVLVTSFVLTVLK
jgi:protein involved in polysaccharide export with SLBB domain